MTALGPRQLTPLALAVLELLHERAMHPYEIQQTMRDRHTDRLVKLKAGSLYHTVERLERLGLIEIAETGRDGRRPERTVYSITDKGKDMFAERLAEMLSTEATEYPEYPVAVAFAHAVDRELVRAQLACRVIALKRSIAADEVTIAELERRDLPHRYWVDVRYTHAMRRAQLEWTNWLIVEMTTGRLPWPSDIADPHLRVVEPPADDVRPSA